MIVEDTDRWTCKELWPLPAMYKMFTIFVLLITYVAPLGILTITYTIVAILLWKRSAPGNAHEGRDSRQIRAKRKVRIINIILMFY